MIRIDIAQKTPDEILEEVANTVANTVFRMKSDDHVNAAATLITAAVGFYLYGHRDPKKLATVVANFVDRVERNFGYELYDSGDDVESKQAAD